MAYLNEFPHVEANKLNLDWLLEQYSTFDKRLQELHDHFDEAVATFETELESFKHDMRKSSLIISLTFKVKLIQLVMR